MKVYTQLESSLRNLDACNLKGFFILDPKSRALLELSKEKGSHAVSLPAVPATGRLLLDLYLEEKHGLLIEQQPTIVAAFSPGVKL